MLIEHAAETTHQGSHQGGAFLAVRDREVHVLPECHFDTVHIEAVHYLLHHLEHKLAHLVECEVEHPLIGVVGLTGIRQSTLGVRRDEIRGGREMFTAMVVVHAKPGHKCHPSFVAMGEK